MQEPEKDRRLGEKTGLPEADTAFPIYLAKPWSPDIHVRTVDLHVTWQNKSIPSNSERDGHLIRHSIIPYVCSDVREF